MRIEKKIRKKIFYTEAAYVIGLAALALGAAFMVVADFGVSMIVAPAYLVHLKLSQTFSFVTFGVAEYILQFLLLILLIVVVRRFHISFCFSFVTALIYGAMLDGFGILLECLPAGGIALRVTYYVVGMLLCTMGVALMFHTYIAPEVYELFVKEVSAKYEISISKVKTVYDCSSLAIAIVLSFLFFGFGQFEGIGIGTVVSAFVNGWLIGRFSALFESHREFKDGLKLRKYFS